MSRIDVGEPITIRVILTLRGPLTTPATGVVHIQRPDTTQAPPLSVSVPVSAAVNGVHQTIVETEYTPTQAGVHGLRFAGVTGIAGIEFTHFLVEAPRFIPT